MNHKLKFLGVFSADYDQKFVLPQLREAMARCGAYEHFNCDRSAPPPADELAARVAGADVILTGWGTPRLPEAVITAPGRKLRYICHIAGQVSPFLSRTFLESDIKVTNWGAEGVWTFAEGTVALIFGCLKEINRIGLHMRQTGASWQFPFSNPAPTLRDKTVGLIGYGAIARTVVEMLTPFMCRFLVYDPFIKDGGNVVAKAATTAASVSFVKELPDLFAQSDIVSVHCGLTPQTTGMIGRDLLDRLKPHAIFINTSRGKVVRQAELVEFLQKRPDVRAGLDVFEQEPLPEDSPLRRMDNVICYGHCVGSGGETFDHTLAGIAARNIDAFCMGKPMKYVITPQQYDRMT